MNFLVGTVQHRRFTPKPHHFLYRLFMVRFNLAMIEKDCYKTWLWSYNRFNLFSIVSSDYIKHHEKRWHTTMIQLFQQHTHYNKTIDRIELVTHPRFLGYSFNPINLFIKSVLLSEGVLKTIRSPYFGSE